jgi:hypothetical protein
MDEIGETSWGFGFDLLLLVPIKARMANSLEGFVAEQLDFRASSARSDSG